MFSKLNFLVVSQRSWNFYYLSVQWYWNYSWTHPLGWCFGTKMFFSLFSQNDICWVNSLFSMVDLLCCNLFAVWSVVHGSAALMSPESLLEMSNLRFNSISAEADLTLNRITCVWKCSKMKYGLQNNSFSWEFVRNGNPQAPSKPTESEISNPCCVRLSWCFWSC